MANASAITLTNIKICVAKAVYTNSLTQSMIQKVFFTYIPAVEGGFLNLSTVTGLNC